MRIRHKSSDIRSDVWRSGICRGLSVCKVLSQKRGRAHEVMLVWVMLTVLAG